MNEEIKNYLKDNLRIQWHYQADDLYICLVLGNEIISKMPFGRE